MSLCSSVRCCAKVLSVVGPVACIHETAFSQVGGSVCGSTSCTCRIRSEEQRIILTISVYIWVSWRWHVRCEVLVLHNEKVHPACLTTFFLLPFPRHVLFSAAHIHMSERASEARPPSASLWFLLCFHAHTSCGSRPPIITFLLCVYAVCVEEEAEVEGRREGSSPSFRPFLVLLPPSSASPFLASLEEPRQGRAERVTNKSGTREGGTEGGRAVKRRSPCILPLSRPLLSSPLFSRPSIPNCVRGANERATRD